jgi:hypothetical protein
LTGVVTSEPWEGVEGRWELWGETDEDGICAQVFIHPEMPKYKQQMTGMSLVWTVVASSWNEAHGLRNEYLGLATYVNPFESGNEVAAAEVNGAHRQKDSE